MAEPVGFGSKLLQLSTLSAQPARVETTLLYFGNRTSGSR
jgi:hypothetical protein